MKFQLREKAIALRRQGWSYREIMKEVPVAKSTISLWLRSVGLSAKQEQRLTDKKREAIKKGAAAKHQQRIENTKIIIDSAKSQVGLLSKRELWLMGIMLYWAEGSKEKAHRPGSGVQFTNMDPAMIHFFLRWLREILNIDKENIGFDLYVHETHKSRVHEIVDFWSKETGFPTESFSHLYFKKATSTMRKNIGVSYFGVLKIKVKSSAVLNRKIAGWTQGVVEFFR